MRSTEITIMRIIIIFHTIKHIFAIHFVPILKYSLAFIYKASPFSYLPKLPSIIHSTNFPKFAITLAMNVPFCWELEILFDRYDKKRKTHSSFSPLKYYLHFIANTHHIKILCKSFGEWHNCTSHLNRIFFCSLGKCNSSLKCFSNDVVVEIAILSVFQWKWHAII